MSGLKQLIAACLAVHALIVVCSDAERAALAFQKWEQDKTPVNLYHLLTAGAFLVKDIET